MVIENGISAIGGLFDFAMVPVNTALDAGQKTNSQPARRTARKLALMEEAGGVSVEKVLLSGEPDAIQSKAIEMIQSGRKLVLEGVPLEEIAAWCFQHNYRWRFHHDISARNAFVLEPGKPLVPDPTDAGSKA
jgi:hypothetical protein